MKNKQWEAIHDIFDKIVNLFDVLRTNPSKDTEAQTENSTKTDNDDIVQIRADIRTQLKFLQANLAEYLSERDSYLVLFPIVAHFDELAYAYYTDNAVMGWLSLQTELFQIDDAGELFYETLDDIIRKPETLPFIFEVYYFCLSHGFRGKHADNPIKINEYLKKLRKKIPVKDIENFQIETTEEAWKIKPVISAMWYYGAAGVVLTVGYFFFYTLAHYWDVNFVSFCK